MTDALYVRERATYLPSALTVGPWSPDAQHGGPVAALLMRAVEHEPAPGPFQVLRMTVELLRPAPLRPLEVATHVSRPGRNVQIIEVTMTAGASEIARARALRIRVLPVPVPEAGGDAPPPPIPDVLEWRHEDLPATGFIGAVDLRFLHGSWSEAGPARFWGRLLVPVVAGEEASRLQQLAAIADFGNGISRVVDFATHTFINPDLTIALSRPPVGEWIGFDAVTRLAPLGFGQAQSQIFDVDGPVGHSLQTLLVSTR